MIGPLAPTDPPPTEWDDDEIDEDDIPFDPYGDFDEEPKSGLRFIIF